MKLTLNSFQVEQIEESRKTDLSGHRLLINRKELRDLLRQDQRLRSVEIDWVHPGESCRIINILDIFEPRVKVSGEGETFPGVLGDAKLVGSGTTNVLKGVSVVTCGPLEGARDALLDMAGPGAELSHFARLETVVVSLTPAEGVSPVEFARASMQAGVRACHFLGGATRAKAPDVSREFGLPGFNPSTALPRVAYVYFLVCYADLWESFLYGRPIRKLVPTPIHPNEVMDGAIVWGAFSRPTKNLTYDHLNNGVIRTLYEAHGESLLYAGTILANHHKLFSGKALNAELVARLAGDILGVDGVLITKDAGGQADTDLMQTCERCEERGIKTAILTMESAGAEGSSAGSLVDTSPRADAIVALGNYVERVRFPRMGRVVGGTRLKDLDQDPREPVEVPYHKIPGAISFFGDNTLSALEF